jgi:tripartite ATP-independent transporter DctM subunit
MGLAWTLANKGHIQIDIVTSRISQQKQFGPTAILSLMGIACAVYLAFYVSQGMVEKYIMGVMSASELPLPEWWPRVPIFIGLVLLALAFAILALQNVIALRSMHDPKEGLPPGWIISLGTIWIGAVIFLLVWPQAEKISLGLVLPVMVFLIFGLLASGTWVFLSLTLAGMLGGLIFTSYPVGLVAAKLLFNYSASWALTCLPLFIFMGELLLRSGGTRHLYAGLGTWVERIPGKLLHSNILACTVFAAISGSGAATTAAIGTVAVPELKRLGYDRGISIGSLAGAGTLGMLIPPSIPLIIYGALTNESIGQLFMGGILPGLMLSSLFMGYILVRAIRRPSTAPVSRSYSWGERMKGSLEITPILISICVVLGSIYFGIATPTEAGAIGALCALGTLVLYKTLSWKAIKEASWHTMRTTCMLMAIFVGASILSVFLGYLRVSQYVMQATLATGLSKYALLGIICLIYIGLGCIFEGASMMVLTLPIVYPIIIGLGFSGIWFGIVLVILIETSQVTPPVGFSLYILQGVAGVTIGYVAKNAFPFFLLMLVAVIVLVLFPQIALILPNMMIVRG